jgi:hypothetical protein
VSARANELAARRLALGARSARLRLELGDEAAALAQRFRFADRVAALARSGGVQALAIGAATLLLFGRPRRLIRTAGRLLLLWPLLRPLVARLAPLWRGE